MPDLSHEHVRLVGVCKTFSIRNDSSVCVLKNITLSCGRGEVIAITGPSGCGKTTLLRLVAGVDHPNDGEVTIGGRPASPPDGTATMVFQSYTSYPWLTVQENVAFGLEDRSEQERLAIVDGLIDSMGLRGFEHHRPKQLSGGMRQRVAVARALAVSPEVLLLDEPFGALDVATRRSMQRLILDLRADESAPTMLLVTHDLEEALTLADRIVVLSQRPARIVEIFDVPWSRGHEVLSTTLEFGALKQRLIDALTKPDIAIA